MIDWWCKFQISSRAAAQRHPIGNKASEAVTDAFHNSSSIRVRRVVE